MGRNGPQTGLLVADALNVKSLTQDVYWCFGRIGDSVLPPEGMSFAGRCGFSTGIDQVRVGIRLINMSIAQLQR